MLTLPGSRTNFTVRADAVCAMVGCEHQAQDHRGDGPCVIVGCECRAFTPLATMRAEVARVIAAATKYKRCCAYATDGFGVPACDNCQRATFAMLKDVQDAIGVDQWCNAVAPKPAENKAPETEAVQ